MAFDAGSVIGHYKLDSSDWEKGSKKVDSSNKGMAKSIFGAQVAFAAFQKVLSLVVDQIKESITKFVEQEKQEAQLEAVLKSTSNAAGLTKEAILEMASSFQQVTTYGDEAILSAQNILLTFTKIGKDTFPLATDTVLNMSTALGQDLKSSAIQLGKALQDPITGVTALRRVGVNLSDEQQQLIKDLVATGRSAEAQAIILKELEVEFGGSARAARDTFGGSLQALSNDFSDLQETQGKYIATAVQPMVEAIDEMVRGFNDFLKSEEGFKQITGILSTMAGVVSVIQEVFGKLWAVVEKFGGTVMDSINENLAKFVDEGNEANPTFDILGGVIQGLSAGFAILGSVLNFVITGIADLVLAAASSIETLGKFGEALFDPLNAEKWDAAAKAGGQALQKFETFGTNAMENLGNIIETTIEEFENFMPAMETNSNDLENAYNTAFDAMYENMQRFKEKSNELIQTNANDIINTTEEMNKDLLKLQEDWIEQSLQMSETESETKIRHLKEQADQYKLVAEDKAQVEEWLQNKIAEVNQSTQTDIADKIRDTWSQTLDGLIEQLNFTAIEFGIASEQYQMIWGDVMEHIQQKMTNMFSYVTLVLNNLTNMWNLYYQNQLTKHDNDYKKRKKNIEKNIKDETLREQMLEDLEEEYAEKTAEIKEKQFKRQKAADIITATINTAVAATKALTAGPIIGKILAGVISGLGAAQIAMIARQPVPEFQEGGTTRGFALVGEEGPELVNFGSTARIFPTEDISKMIGGGVTQNITFTGDINSEVDIERTLQLAGAAIERRAVG